MPWGKGGEPNIVRQGSVPQQVIHYAAVADRNPGESLIDSLTWAPTSIRNGVHYDRSISATAAASAPQILFSRTMHAHHLRKKTVYARTL